MRDRLLNSKTTYLLTHLKSTDFLTHLVFYRPELCLLLRRFLEHSFKLLIQPSLLSRVGHVYMTILYGAYSPQVVHLPVNRLLFGGVNRLLGGLEVCNGSFRGVV